MTYKKPQSPIMSGTDGIYPLTTADQIIKADGSRLEQGGKIMADDSAKLGGRPAAAYALTADLTEKANISIISDEWQSGKTYNTGEYCIYNSNLYKALVQTIAEPISGTDWQIVELAGEFVKFNNALAPLSLLKDLAVYRTTGADNRNITVEFNTNFGSINLPYVTFAVIGDGYMSYGRVGKVVNLGESSISATYDTNKNTVTFTVGSFANAALLLFVTDANYCIANITQS